LLREDGICSSVVFADVIWLLKMTSAKKRCHLPIAVTLISRMFIYKQYTQAALNYQYNNRLQVADYATHFEQWEQRSRQTESQYPMVKNIVYGSHARERLDIYPSPQPNSKTLIFIHGGYWKSMVKESFHFVAGAFQPNNITTVFIEYPLMPEVPMDELVNCCRKAISWVQENIGAYNGNPQQIYIAGHSAGGHLAAMLMTDPNMETTRRNAFKGVIAISGLFNLLPIRLCYLNDDLKMDEATALRSSPVHLQPIITCPLLLAVGADESSEFKDQSAELHTSWNKQVPVQLIEIAGYHHFSIVEALADKNTELHKAVCGMMGLFC
jgi:arylformamidase